MPESINYEDVESNFSIDDISTTSEADDVRILRRQLEKAQSLLQKQDSLKLRLKTELAHTRSELNNTKTQLTIYRSSNSRIEDLEEELDMAKDMLNSFKAELSLSKDAHYLSC